MVALPHETPQHMTESEYLNRSQTSEIKVEFVSGRVVAMTGATWQHGVICSNLVQTLGNQLLEQPCIVVASDLRLRIAATTSYRYPDVMVICGNPDFFENRRDTVTNPVVVAEVLSPSTALIDRTEKLREYRQLASVQDYLLIEADEARIECFTRNSGGWLYRDISGLEGELDLVSIGCRLRLKDVYHKLTFGA
jgi:Uma2 family endonuclease